MTQLSKKSSNDPDYGPIFEGILQFKGFAEAEETLRRLENLCQQFQEARDKRGVAACREVALLGRRRAEGISRNRRVGLRKRLIKQEIALWFRIWLETPELFWEWLELRKRTPDFLELQDEA